MVLGCSVFLCFCFAFPFPATDHIWVFSVYHTCFNGASYLLTWEWSEMEPLSSSSPVYHKKLCLAKFCSVKHLSLFFFCLKSVKHCIVLYISVSLNWYLSFLASFPLSPCFTSGCLPQWRLDYNMFLYGFSFDSLEWPSRPFCRAYLGCSKDLVLDFIILTTGPLHIHFGTMILVRGKI